jgi:hypothetical protein
MVGAKPYGHYPGEAKILEEMRKDYAKGVPLRRIATTLNANGIPPRRRQRWYARSVQRILQRG